MQKNIIKLVGVLFFGTCLLQGECQPEEYHQSNTGQFKHAIKELHKLNFSGTEKILDIGCGDGRISTYIAQHYIPEGQLVGLDNDSQMIAFALSSAMRGANVSYVQADIAEYVSYDQYDVIVSFWALHWVAEYANAMKNIAESLKLDGKALLCHVIGTDPLQPMVNELLDTEKWNAYKKDHITLLHAPSLSQVVEAIEKAGLKVEDLEVKKNIEWVPLEKMKQNLLSLPFFDFIPSYVRAEFCDEVLQKCITKYPLNDKGEFCDWLPVIVMVLEK